MAAGDNNPRMFAETISLDAWHKPFDGTTGEADLHIDVGFMQGGRVGGGDEPVRFRLSLKRAEIRVVPDSADVIEIKPSTVSHPDLPSPAQARHTTKRIFRFGGGIMALFSPRSAKVAAKAGAERQVEITDTFDQSETVTKMKVTPWKTDRGYAFAIEAQGGQGLLDGRPWDRSVSRMTIRDTKVARKRGEPPEVRIEIHCLREDLDITDITLIGEHFPLWSVLTGRTQIVVEQWMKDELARAGLPCGDLSDKFTRIILGDVTPMIET